MEETTIKVENEAVEVKGYINVKEEFKEKEEQDNDAGLSPGEVKSATEEEDDVPSDFFDDFSNQDFMDGLDVVDAWNEGDASNVPTLENNNSQADNETSDTVKPSTSNKSDKNKSNENSIRPKDKEREKLKERYKKYKESRGDRNDRKEKMLCRRDPEKTKRDIQRDKDKCAKDLETKAMNEKLKLVESALVPPGTEMDIDLSTLKPQTRKSLSTEDKLRRSNKRSKSRSRKREYILDKIEYLESRFRRSDSRELNRAYSRENFRYKDRHEHYEIGYKRRISRSPRRSSDYDRRLSYEYEYSKYSPTRRRRLKARSRSPRDKWLHYRKSPRRSPSPKYKKYRRDKSEEKLSFLKEIREKLNETTPRPVQETVNPSMQHLYNPMPMNTVPPAAYYPQQPILPMNYGQEFFMGQNNSMCTPMYDCSTYNNQINPASVPTPQFVPNTDWSIPSTENSVKDTSQNTLKDIQAVTKLFEEKKISLSDFLSVAAKSTDSSMPAIQNKVKVISRCQDAINEIEGNNVNGRFFYKKTAKEATEVEDIPHPSPFRSIPTIRFRCTTNLRNEDEAISSSVKQLLMNLNLLEQNSQPSISLDKSENTVENKVSSVKIDASNVFNSTESLFGVKYKMKMVQTEPFECCKCAARENILKANKEMQTMSALTFDVAVQVNEKDLQPKGIQQNQSLAMLTPAQLLAQTSKQAPPPPTLEQNVEGPPAKMKKSPVKANLMKNKNNDFKARGSGKKYFRSERLPNNRFEYNNFDTNFTEDDFSTYKFSQDKFFDSNEGNDVPNNFKYNNTRNSWFNRKF